MIENMMPNEIEIAARRQVRLERQTVIVLERVRAHVDAFARAATPVMRAGR
jgi:hypothetical protein